METETVKTETDVGVPSEGDSISMEPYKIYIPSVFSIEKYEPELNSVAVKVERDVDVVGEEDCTDMKTDEVCRPSVLCVKTEYENCTDVLETVPGFCTETCLSPSDIKVEEDSDIPEEEDPLAVTSPAAKAEQENIISKPQLTHVEVHPYACGVCNKSYTNPNSLRKHKRIHSQGQAFSCDVCNKPFTYQNDLKKHQRIHTGERPYSCGVCNKSFSEQGSLKKHQRIHTGDRPFSCGVCNESFTEQSSLKRHQRVHSGERPYTCGVCSKSFTEQGSVKKHQRIHTGERPYSCGVCHKSFSEQGSLKKHQRIHSGTRKVPRQKRFAHGWHKYQGPRKFRLENLPLGPDCLVVSYAVSVLMLCETFFKVEWELLLKYIMENSAKQMSGQKGVCHDQHI